MPGGLEELDDYEDYSQEDASSCEEQSEEHELLSDSSEDDATPPDSPESDAVPSWQREFWPDAKASGSEEAPGRTTTSASSSPRSAGKRPPPQSQPQAAPGGEERAAAQGAVEEPERECPFDYEEFERRMRGEEGPSPQEPGEPDEEAESDSPVSAEPTKAAPDTAYPAEYDIPVPDLKDLLNNLEKDENRDSADRAATMGMKVADLENPQEISALEERLDRAQKMTFAQLRVEYEQRGFVTPDFIMSRSEMIPRVREVLRWEVMKPSALWKVCEAKGITAEQGQTRTELLDLLAAPTWETYGIPVQRFEDKSVARTVLENCRDLETFDVHELADFSRQWKLPVGTRTAEVLRANLKEAYIWFSLRDEELQKEVDRLGGPPLDPETMEALEQTTRQALFRRLTDSLWGSKWAERLQSAPITEDFIREFDCLDTLSGRPLEAAYECKGLRICHPAEDSDLVNQLRDALIWKTLPMSVLRRRCRDRELEVKQEEDEEALRTAMVHALAEDGCMVRWIARGLLPQRVNDYNAAFKTIEYGKEVERMTMKQLLEYYDQLGFPKEADMTKEELKALFMKIFMYQESPVSELEKECKRLGLSEEAPRNVEGSEEAQPSHRDVLCRRLLNRDRMDHWEEMGYEAHRLGSVDNVLQVVANYDHFQSLGITELQEKLNDQGVPAELVTGKRKVLEILKKMLIWEYLPLEELQSECRQQNLPEEAPAKDDQVPPKEEQRMVLVRQLKVSMGVTLKRSTMEEKGIPVERLNPLSADLLDREYDYIDSMSTEDLRNTYRGWGCPEEEAMERGEIQKVMKAVYLWRELGVEELRKECQRCKVDAEKVKQAQGDSAEKEQLENLLLDRDRMNSWEAKGFRAHSLGDTQKVIQVVRQYEQWRRMDGKELEKEYQRAGLELPPPKTDKTDRVMILKDVIIWELMSLPVLQKELRDRNIQVWLDTETDREQAIKWMVRSTWYNTWTSRGIPAERLGSIELAEELIVKVDQLTTAVTYYDMIDQGTNPLQEEYRRHGLPFDPKLSKEVHIARVRGLLVWNSLPLNELRRECKSHGIQLPREASAINPKAKGLTPPSSLQGPPGALAGPKGLGNLPGLPGLNALKWQQIHGRGNLTGGRGIGTALGLGNTKGGKGAAVPFSNFSISQTATQKPFERISHMAQTKESKEEEATMRKDMIDKLVLVTWTDSWKPRGIPADQLGSVKLVGKMMSQVDEWEAMSRDQIAEVLGMNATHTEKNVLLGRLKNQHIWHSLSTAELQRECRRVGVWDADSFYNLKHEEIVERLADREILLEAEALGVPVLKVEDIKRAVSLMIFADEYSFDKLKEWYVDNFPEERSVGRAELLCLFKLIAVWEEMPLKELRKECEKAGVQEEEPQEGDSNDVRDNLVQRMIKNNRMGAWEARGFQAWRVGSYENVAGCVTSYEKYQDMDEKELSDTLKQHELTVKNQTREELLGILKMFIIWEMMPLDEVRNECIERHVSMSDMNQQSYASSEEERLELVFFLKVDLTVHLNKDAYEERKIPVDRLGSWRARTVALTLDGFQAMGNDELQNTYSRIGGGSKALSDRQMMLDLMRNRLIWEMMPKVELQKECLDRNLPISVDDDFDEIDKDESTVLSCQNSSTCSELVRRLTVDMHVRANADTYRERGIPIGRVTSLQADNLAGKFTEFAEWDIDQLRRAQEEYKLPPAPSCTKTELLKRIEAAAIWQEFKIEELQAECESCGLPYAREGTGPVQHREILLDRLRLHRCAKTFTEQQVPVKQLKTLTAAQNVRQAWDELSDLTNSQLTARYKSWGLSSYLVEMKDIKERLKRIEVYMQMPFEDLKELYSSMSSISGPEDRHTLVKRVVLQLWPAKPPPQPKPTPPPPPRREPPPNFRPPPRFEGRPPPPLFKQEDASRLVTYFHALGLTPSASMEEVKKAYRRLARSLHPDKTNNDEAKAVKFKEVGEAYEKLDKYFSAKKR